MKRRTRSLNLHRETLQNLTPQNEVVGGVGSQTCSVRCKIESWCMCTDGTCAPSATC